MFENLLRGKPTEQTNTESGHNPQPVDQPMTKNETNKGVNPIWVTWKIQIARDMSNQVRKVYRKHGFGTQAELIRYLLRRWLDDLPKEKA